MKSAATTAEIEGMFPIAGCKYFMFRLTLARPVSCDPQTDRRSQIGFHYFFADLPINVVNTVLAGNLFPLIHKKGPNGAEVYGQPESEYIKQLTLVYAMNVNPEKEYFGILPQYGSRYYIDLVQKIEVRIVEKPFDTSVIKSWEEVNRNEIYTFESTVDRTDAVSWLRAMHQLATILATRTENQHVETEESPSALVKAFRAVEKYIKRNISLGY